MIAPLVAERMDRLHKICERYRVERLYLFGSAANGEMRPSGNVDFLVEFREERDRSRNRHLEMVLELDDLFGMEVGLADYQAIQNPYFREEVEETRKLIYESESQTIPA